MLHAVSKPVRLLEKRAAESVEALMQQLLWLCFHLATNPLVYNFVLVKIYAILRLCKYVWNIDIIRFYIASQC